ncbi:hypothetical protein Chor_010602 [Crotalus horridus]
MYAFYSLLVLLFYALFKRGDAGAAGAARGRRRLRRVPQALPLARPARGHRAFSEELSEETPKTPSPHHRWLQLIDVDSSSESDRGSPSDEEGEEDDLSLDEAPTPLTEFLALKREAAAAEREMLCGKPPESPLVQMMLQLFSFLERYTQLQQLQEKAGEYRSRLHWEESRWRRQKRALKRACQQRLRSSGLLCPVAPGGLHQLVESLSALQGERSRLAEEVVGLQQRVEEREREKQQLARSFHHQIRGLKQQIQAQEKEREQIRMGMENEALRSQLLQLEASLQQKVEELMCLEECLDRPQSLQEGEVRQLDKQLCGLQLPREGLKSPPPAVQGPAKGLPADPSQELQALAQAEEQNRLLMQQLSSQAQRCQQLAEQLQSSEGAVTALRHKISAYEKEVTGLRQELLQEIHRLEEQKEVAVQEACRGSEERARPLCQQLAGWGLLGGLFSPFTLPPPLQMFSVIREVAQSSRCLQERYQREVQLRKKYHDQLLELKGNIRVLCRLKPLTEEEQQEGGQGGPGVEASPAEDGCVTACYKGKEHRFRLDKVFLPCATQEEVFLEIEPVVLSCLQGYNVCIFAYGQTGSGKTYTMEGHPGNPGITQRALQALYQEMEAKQAEAWKFPHTFWPTVSFLRPWGGGEGRTIPATKRSVPFVPPCRGEVQSLLQSLENFANHIVLPGKLNLVDLAGSERVWKSGAQGERLKEAQSINRSLLALGEVIQALRTKQAHVPFRNSKLTYLLQDSLGKGSKTVMMVQICPLEKNLGESICSLKFAQRVCKVELGPASRRIKAPDQCEV